VRCYNVAGFSTRAPNNVQILFGHIDVSCNCAYIVTIGNQEHLEVRS